MVHPERFWLEEPKDLFRRFTILPCHQDTFEEKLNTVTRLIIIITIVMYLLKWKHWFTFLIIALCVLVAIYLMKPEHHDLIEHFNEDLDNFTYYGEQEVDLSTVPIEDLYTHIVMPEVPFEPRKSKSAYEHMMASNRMNGVEEEIDESKIIKNYLGL